MAVPSRAVRHDTDHTISLLAPHLHDGDRVLDVGCGSAWVTAALASRGHETWGIDIVDCRRAALDHFALYDGVTIDFPDASFDVVLLAFVLHHVPDDDKPRLLAEARRVCRRALLIVEDTPRTAFDRLVSRRHGEKYRRSIGSTAPFGFYTQGEWEQLFARERLELIESRRLGRFCRDWLQPYARAFFALSPRAAA